MEPKKIAIIVGSLRKASLNRKMAENLISVAPSSLKLEIVEIGRLEMYNQDLDEHPTQAWTEFRNKMREFDGVIFVTPEYNRSFSAAIKNAIDVGSRPYGQSVWAKKPGAVMSVSPGGLSGFGANHHLRQTLVFLDIPVMQQPEAYIGHAGDLFGEDGKIQKESTLKFVTGFMESYADWVKRLS